MTDVPLSAGAGAAAGPARRIFAMVLRYWYLLRGSWPRLLELAYWPTVQMLVWGLLTAHLSGDSDWIAQAAGVLIGAVLLWDVLFRGQLGVSISFLEEMWSRNMGQLFVSPLRPREWIVALMTMSLVRTLIGVVPAALLAAPLFGFNALTMGVPLAAFFANLLVCGWWIALVVTSLILRYGLGAESLAWALVFLLAPIACVYYPVDVLPAAFQWLALALPPAHVFEGMRGVLFGGGFSMAHFAWAAGLNALYMAAAGAFFLRSFDHARRHGALLQQGE
jgi:ABC-2 type transport system permease protein